ncbi:hypothetical protein [Pseudomonas mediterranea]|jgi:hypothetical protein|uniref:Phage-like protein n=1 Tax=Pseudomonas mediterranea TaxID=183795 RepID=A0AAX2DID3_9PSED|nr:hypothetical protein [Pseudomonas mediterranea]KGU84760.1 hypothetical protein N005_15455 [Pseudomonas mediterranea CFBP 5447]MBL0841185.1 hypothetical protein [Pseudomonas mediterranea]UZE02190.1 hypothetical protein LOY71_06035 [Pseudomonas mediterranea]CAH0161128.1 hypothetical protein SRABI112_00929 [Pseudomonas mediterranea]SDU74284.1 hypothetical protein SAMN05216476_5180 [Pseudomonas mediterranea]
MALRQTYTVLVPFPTGGGHWSSIGQELDLLDIEASALRSAGRLALKNTEVADAASTSQPAKKAATKKAE